jgi:hypothetical protein
MTQHTPGPWEQYGSVVYSVNGVICELSEPRAYDIVRHEAVDIGSKDWDEAMANARLITQAPELLQAAVKIAAIWQPGKYSQKKMDAAVDELRAIIAKATE